MQIDPLSNICRTDQTVCETVWSVPYLNEITAMPGACVSPERVSYRQASQEAPKNPPLASLAPQPVNGRCLSNDNFLTIVKLLFSSHFARCLKLKLFCRVPPPAEPVVPLTPIKNRSAQIWTLRLVRVAGFEPTASWSRTKRDTKLRHTRI